MEARWRFLETTLLQTRWFQALSSSLVLNSTLTSTVSSRFRSRARSLIPEVLYTLAPEARSRNLSALELGTAEIQKQYQIHVCPNYFLMPDLQQRIGYAIVGPGHNYGDSCCACRCPYGDEATTFSLNKLWMLRRDSCQESASADSVLSYKRQTVGLQDAGMRHISLLTKGFIVTGKGTAAL
jgi:hypothetical protein